MSTSIPLSVSVQEADFDAAELQRGLLAGGNAEGAVVTFTGYVRSDNERRDVQSMELEHYPGMTEKYLEKITQEAMEKWDLLDAMIIHRIGEVSPNDTIVLVAVWSAHRAAAFDASRYLMEELKSRAPFWKKEQLDESSRWVETNTPG